MSADPLLNLLINYLCGGFGKCWNRNLTHNIISLWATFCVSMLCDDKNLTQICAASVTFCAESEPILHTQRTRFCCMHKLDLLGATTL